MGPAHLRSRTRSGLLRFEWRRTGIGSSAGYAGRNTGRHEYALCGPAQDRRSGLETSGPAGDNWDQECTFEMMIINTPVNPSAPDLLAVNPNARRGPRKTLTGVPCKTGIAWSFDAANGEFLWAKPTNEQNIVARIDPKGLVTVNENAVLKDVNKTYHVCPTYNGGRDWPQGAYNPKSNVMYIPLSNLCIDSTARTDRGVQPQFV